MSNWQRDTAKYEVAVNGQRQETRLWVQGAMDPTESERPRVILEEHHSNEGLSLHDERARDQAIDSLSKSMKVNPNEVDWYVRTWDPESGQGSVQAVEVFQSEVTKTNPEFTHWENSGEFNINNRDEAKKLFPDITVDELKSQVKEPSNEQANQLSEAFNGQHQESLNTHVQEHETQQQQSKHIDLSQEYFNLH
jgi:hypothetical protein